MVAKKRGLDGPARTSQQPRLWTEMLGLRTFLEFSSSQFSIMSLPPLGVSSSVLPSEGGSPSLHLTVPFPLGSPDGSAVFRGCFRRPDNLSLALPVTAAMPNMSVDKCVDLCTEKVSLLPHTEFQGGWCRAAGEVRCLAGGAATWLL